MVDLCGRALAYGSNILQEMGYNVIKRQLVGRDAPPSFSSEIIVRVDIDGSTATVYYGVISDTPQG